MNKKQTDYFEALYEMARVINASLDPGKVLNKIAASVTKGMNVKACILRLLDSRGKCLVLGASHGLSEGYIHKGPILIAESGLDKKVLKGRTAYIENAQTDKGFQYGDKAKSEGIKSVLVVPLMLEKKAIGVLRVYADHVRAFREEEVLFLKAVANLSAIALDNARLHQTLKTDCDLMAAHKYRIDDN